MATVMKMRWPGVTTADYDRVLEELDLESNPADGGIVHIAFELEGALGVVDVWESQQDFETFRDERLGPAMEAAGLSDRAQPEIKFFDCYNYFALTAERELVGV